MRRVLTAACAALAALALSVGCGAVLGLDDLEARGGDGGGADASSDAGPTSVTTASKIDLLLVVDDSPSAKDTALKLSSSMGTLLTRLTKLSDDIHVGVIGGSLGSLGGDYCAGTRVGGQLSRDSAAGGPVPGTDRRFLEYGGVNRDVDALVANSAALVLGLGQEGCVFSAPLETAYRFLVQPDPWKTADAPTMNRAQLVGVDADILIQRKAFLRPDSLVLVVLLTARDELAPDPRSFSGRGWAFTNSKFPGSIGGPAPRGTSACANSPASQACFSCGCLTNDAACSGKASDPECQKMGGWYDYSEDAPLLRPWHMRQRFGVDAQFPVARYVDGFSKSMVPDRAGEHASVDGQLSEYMGSTNCSNPLFAAELPDPAGDLCNLVPGTRGKELVVFTVIGGVPPGLAGADPDWRRIVGENPDAFDLSGLDPHMIQSPTPRAGLPPPPPAGPKADNGADPVHGREFETFGNDLQYACTFRLPAGRTCSDTDPSCDCRSNDGNPPLCLLGSNRQIRGKAYPSPRVLRVAKGLGDRAAIGSVCDDNYNGTMNRIADRIAPKLVK